MGRLDELREKALANFETLLDYCKIEYRKVTEHEYDILATWREDKNFGSVRFNTEKNRGADFAGGSLLHEDYSRLGIGFDKEDFSGFTKEGQAAKIGFDVIGLFQRIFRCDTYKQTSEALGNIFTKIPDGKLYNPTIDSAARRQQDQKAKEQKYQKLANDLWESSKYHKWEGSIGELYLNKRGIFLREKNIRFHPSIQYGTQGTKYPALLFKVQKAPDGPLVAIHRIFLDQSGTKAKLDNPKMALAPVKGAGIWFGEPSSILNIAEGPENALTLREWGAKFTVSSIFSTNLHNLTIPKCVKEIIIYPDTDKAGMAALERAKHTYTSLGLEKIEGRVISLPGVDLNDLA